MRQPTVITASSDNALPYFRLSAAIREIAKGSAAAFFRNPPPRRRLAGLLVTHGDRGFLLP